MAKTVEEVWKIVDENMDALNRLTQERDLLADRVRWLEKHLRKTYRGALEAAQHWLEEERDAEHPGQTAPDDILKGSDDALRWGDPTP